MPLARKCIRCGRTFLAKKDEQYCAQCTKDELMAILKKDKPPTPAKEEPPKEEVKEKVMTKCKNCGKMFEQTGKGRPAVNCPECRESLKHESKATAKVRHIEPEPKATPTVMVATDEDKAKMYGKIESNSVVPEATSTSVSVADVKPTDTMNDAVHHPSHYTLPGLTVESVDVIRAVLTSEEFKGWCKGNAIKYSLRAGRKDPTKEVQDLAKAGVFLSWITGE